MSLSENTSSLIICEEVQLRIEIMSPTLKLNVVTASQQLAKSFSFAPFPNIFPKNTMNGNTRKTNVCFDVYVTSILRTILVNGVFRLSQLKICFHNAHFKATWNATICQNEHPLTPILQSPRCPLFDGSIEISTIIIIRIVIVMLL